MLISFIVPVYNAEKYLKPCVDSLLEQTYSQLEIILVDDGSTDHSGKICDEYAEKDPRVRVFHQENGGVHTARNLGICEAKGDYILFVDADDWIDSNTVQTVYGIIHEHYPDVVRFTYIRELDNRSVKKTNTFVTEGLSTGIACKKVFRQTMGLVEQEWTKPENFNFLATTCTSAYKRSLLITHNIRFEPREPIGSFEDGLFNLQFMQIAESFYYMDEGFYHYRKTNAESCTANYRTDYLQKQTKLFERLYEMASGEQELQLKNAFYNRVIFSNLELCLNAVKSSYSIAMQCKEIREILNSEFHCKAAEYIEFRWFSLKWKVYFFFIKHQMTVMVYLMTRVIRYIQKRGG